MEKCGERAEKAGKAGGGGMRQILAGEGCSSDFRYCMLNLIALALALASGSSRNVHFSVRKRWRLHRKKPTRTGMAFTLWSAIPPPFLS